MIAKAFSGCQQKSSRGREIGRIAHGAGSVDEGLVRPLDIATFIYALGFNWASNRGVQGGHWERLAQRFSFDLPSVSYGKFFSGGHYPSSYKLSFMQ